MAKDEFSLTSLVVVIVVSGFIIRHFFFRGPSSSDASSGDASTRQAREQAQAETLNNRYEEAVAQIQQIFPYVDRRDVWWELRRNGLNVGVTSERILSGGLDNPPVTFQPPPLPTAVIAAAAATAANAATPVPKQQSLIERYNLQDRLNEPEAPASPSSSSSVPGRATSNKTWSSNKEERQAMLKKRRDDMIIAARRKMEAKIAAEKTAQKQ